MQERDARYFEKSVCLDVVPGVLMRYLKYQVPKEFIRHYEKKGWIRRTDYFFYLTQEGYEEYKKLRPRRIYLTEMRASCKQSL